MNTENWPWTINDFLNAMKENPGKTAEEIHEIASQYKIERENKERQRKIDSDKHYDSLVGRYFIVNFNNHSKIFFQLQRDKNYNDYFRSKTYGVINSDNEWDVFSEMRTINKTWLPNPYEKPNNAIVECKEITKEQFDELYNDLKIAKEINEKLMKNL